MKETFSKFTDAAGSDYVHVFSTNNGTPRPISFTMHAGPASFNVVISVEHAEQIADMLMDVLDWIREAPAREYAAEQAETAACEQQERGSPERPEFDARTQILPAFLTREAI